MPIISTRSKVISLLSISTLLLLYANFRLNFSISEVIADETELQIAVRLFCDLAPLVVGPIASIICIYICAKYIGGRRGTKNKAVIGITASIILLLLYLVIFFGNIIH